jgi:hypothetical protein
MDAMIEISCIALKAWSHHLTYRLR